MKYSAFLLAFLSSTVAASPIERNNCGGGGQPQPYNPCPDPVFNIVLCCRMVSCTSTSYYECEPPNMTPTSRDQFRATCFAQDRRFAECCRQGIGEYGTRIGEKD
ncbi:hypothetical protein M426DRAFT_25108 [Hypoxylon sp. CI-4A]|nr:hypothetical protein M426DRAFT_25108 [Hypoxylon sp. CI-4A]